MATWCWLDMKSLIAIIIDNEAADRVTAKRLVETHGAELIGQQVWTPPMGDYPGGVATVTEVAHDPNAPEISFLVEHPTEGCMGIFEYEHVRIVGLAQGHEF